MVLPAASGLATTGRRHATGDKQWCYQLLQQAAPMLLAANSVAITDLLFCSIGRKNLLPPFFGFAFATTDLSVLHHRQEIFAATGLLFCVAGRIYLLRSVSV